MRIKNASIDDCEEILKLQKIAYQSESRIYNDYSIPPLVETIENTLEDFSHKIFLKVIIDDKIVGSVRAYQDDNTCYIGKLIVHPKYQDQGIGTQLLQTIESYFPEIERYELFTGEKSEKNLYLYQKLGYKVHKTENLNEKVNIHYLEKLSHPKK
jgi:N-acetylglutamate synthase-like GNAT family acetyltransferase